MHAEGVDLGVLATDERGAEVSSPIGDMFVVRHV